MNARLFLLGLFAWPVLAANPVPGEVPPDLARDMATIEGYFDAVRDRQGAAMAKPAAKPLTANDRDPFQVTPELRSRSERRLAAKSLASAAPGLSSGGGEPLPPMRIKALMVGGGPGFAVLTVEEDQGKSRDMVVRQGDPLQFADSPLVFVLSIGRQGVLIGSGPDADDKVLLK